MSTVNRYLMCRPDYFEVSYAINPWMEGNINGICVERVRQQWRQLSDLISQYAEVALLEPQPGLPDMVFTANAGLVIGDKAVVSRFRHPEPQGEEKYFRQWFTANHYTVHKLPPKCLSRGRATCFWIESTVGCGRATGGVRLWSRTSISPTGSTLKWCLCAW